jgi:RNA polymerase sigma factor (sigma-70 family)
MTGDGATRWRPEQERAFVDLITELEGELLGFIQHHVRSRGDPWDFVQQIFLLAWSNPEFDPEHAHARAWLFQRARWLVADWSKSAENSSISLEDLSEGMRKDGSWGSRSAEPVDRRAHDPLIALIEAEKNRNLHAALAQLPEDERDAVEWYYLREKRTQFEIAQTLRITVACFNTRLNRGRKGLKRAIQILRGRDVENGAGYDPY